MPDYAPDYVNDIINRIPTLGRQVAAGVATIPSETVRFGTMLAHPMRTYRALTGGALPEDDVGVVPAIESVDNAYNAGVNNLLNVRDHSILDDTAQASARFAGGAIPRAPMAAANTVIQNAPAIVRGG